MSLPPFTDLILAILGIVLGAVALRSANGARRAARRARSAPPPLALRAPEPAVPAELYALRAEVQRLARELEQIRSAVERLTPQAQHPQPAVDAAERSAPLAPSASETVDTVPTGRPVELDGESLRLSRSLSALGSLVVGQGVDGRASLYLNDQIEIDHVAFERWSRFFDFRGGQPYARYRTVQPARVEWNEETGRGRPVSPGVAEVLS